jgi:hypothetical protein
LLRHNGMNSTIRPNRQDAKNAKAEMF